MNISRWQCAALCIFRLLNLWITGSCDSQADVWYKDTFHCPCPSQNPRPFSINNHHEPPYTLRKWARLGQTTIKTRTHTFSALFFFTGFCKLPKYVGNLFFLHRPLPSRCRIFSFLFLQLIPSFSGQLTHLPLWFGWIWAKLWRTEDAVRTESCNLHHLLFKTFKSTD